MIYLVHLNRPLKHARHYLGYTQDHHTLEYRIMHHRASRGAKILKACNDEGITYQITRIWETGERIDERRLKGHSSVRYCPLCNPYWYRSGLLLPRKMRLIELEAVA